MGRAPQEGFSEEGTFELRLQDEAGEGGSRHGAGAHGCSVSEERPVWLACGVHPACSPQSVWYLAFRVSVGDGDWRFCAPRTALGGRAGSVGGRAAGKPCQWKPGEGWCSQESGTVFLRIVTLEGRGVRVQERWQ